MDEPVFCNRVINPYIRLVVEKLAKEKEMITHFETSQILITVASLGFSLVCIVAGTVIIKKMK